MFFGTSVVFLLGDLFEVIGVAAGRVEAEVIDFHVWEDGAVKVFEDEAVSEDADLLAIADAAELDVATGEGFDSGDVAWCEPRDGARHLVTTDGSSRFSCHRCSLRVRQPCVVPKNSWIIKG